MDESCKIESHGSMSSICFYSEHDYTVQPNDPSPMVFCRKMVAGQILRDYLVLSHGFCNDRHISLGIYWSPNAAGRALPGTAGRGKPSRSHLKMLAQGNLAVDEVGGWVPDWGMNGRYIYIYMVHSAYVYPGTLENEKKMAKRDRIHMGLVHLAAFSLKIKHVGIEIPITIH